MANDIHDTLVETRRRRLREWIEARHGTATGNLSAFIEAAGINQGELSGLLRTKSFGERRARKLEEQAGMPPRWLDGGIDATAADIIKHLAEEPAAAYTQEDRLVAALSAVMNVAGLTLSDAVGDVSALKRRIKRAITADPEYPHKTDSVSDNIPRLKTPHQDIEIGRHHNKK